MAATLCCFFYPLRLDSPLKYHFSSKTRIKIKEFPIPGRGINGFHYSTTNRRRGKGRGRGRGIRCGFLPVDPWSPAIDSQSIASQLFAASLFPYLAFLYYITKSKTAPKLTLFGFYFLLVFVGATIPAGIYAKVHYGTSLANVDWLHGGAESLLTITNLIIVLGLREALRNIKDVKKEIPESGSEVEDKQSSG